ncbi:MAG TPA: thioesterase family protein [Acidimicrobiales bacterium]|nr:thioesterase family protein [Acidimicrobiales bacterium]
MSTQNDDALFHPDGDLWVPRDFSRGPWSPDALHGGPVAALIGRAVTRCPSDEEMHVARLTVELLRPVPVVPLSVSTTVSRPGRKVQLVDVRVTSAGQDLAWGRALRIRRLAEGSDAAFGLADVTTEGPVPGRDAGAPPGPDDGHRSPGPVQGYSAFHSDGAELRFVVGEFGRRGPSTVWVRLAVPVVPGETPSSLERVAAASDFGNGVSSLFDFQNYLFINPDLSVFIDRPAVDEWIGLEARTTLGTAGVGLAQSVLWDVQGPLGTSLQNLLVERRT